MNIRNLTISLLLILSSGAALAQESDEPEMKFYDVEIVIFKNVKVPKGSEYILPVSSPLIDEDILDLSSPRSLAAAKEKLFDIVPESELRLLESVKKIVDSPRYSLLLHTAWRQPGLEIDKALPVWIKGGRVFGNEYTSIDDYATLLDVENTDTAQQSAESSGSLSNAVSRSQGPLYELEGKITIALARYLHTFADLVLRKPRLTIDPDSEASEVAQFQDDDLPDARILNNHQLKEQRRMRSKRLHYLDSPEFSLLILITPYEAPESTEESVSLLIENS